jgi:hypothetical protein
MKPGFSLVSLFVVLALLLIAAGCTQPSPATVPHSPEKTAMVNVTTNETLVAFVHEAVAYAQTHGKEAALAEFSNPNGTFVRGELYIYAYDFNSTTLAHPFSPEKIGVNRRYERDALGNLNAMDFINAVHDGTGYLWFYYENPVHNNAIEKKLGYVAKVDAGWWLGSGVYYGPLEQSPASSPDTPSSTQEIRDYVDSAAAFAKKNGKDAALVAFNNKSGPFTRVISTSTRLTMPAPHSRWHTSRSWSAPASMTSETPPAGIIPGPRSSSQRTVAGISCTSTRTRPGISPCATRSVTCVRSMTRTGSGPASTRARRSWLTGKSGSLSRMQSPL